MILSVVFFVLIAAFFLYRRHSNKKKEAIWADFEKDELAKMKAKKVASSGLMSM